MAICQRMHWSVERDWLTLPEWERVDWLAWRVRQRRERRQLLAMMQYEETNDQGETKHYVRDYGAYIDVLKELSDL